MKYLAREEETNAIRWMNEASLEAKKALCLKALCGTVVVKDGAVIGRGYNAPPRDDISGRMCLTEKKSGKPGYDQTCCMHAEWRAISDALRNNPDKIAGSKLYFTRVDAEGETKKSGKPYCTVCSRLALDAGIAEFLLWHEEGICSYPSDEYNRLSCAYKDEHEEKKA